MGRTDCLYCGEPLPNNREYFCSDKCVAEQILDLKKSIGELWNRIDVPDWRDRR